MIYIAVDFDGTCVTHEFPKVGKEIGAAAVLKYLISQGHKIVLNTMRSDALLQEAVDWFAGHGIELSGVNNNPGQAEWTRSPKVYAHLYIDDAALGCPLRWDPDFSDRPFVDWEAVESIVKHPAFAEMPKIPIHPEYFLQP